jgi:hypothetical protein
MQMKAQIGGMLTRRYGQGAFEECHGDSSLDWIRPHQPEDQSLWICWLSVYEDGAGGYDSVWLRYLAKLM